MKPFRTTIALAVLFALLGGFYYYQSRREKPAADQRGKLFAAAEKDVQALTLTRADRVIRAERQGDAWKLLQPIEAPGDGPAIGGLLSAIAGSRIERVIEEKPASLQEYGLEKPGLTLTLEGKGASVPLGLRLGDKNPSGTWVYAQRAGDPAVFLLPSTLQTELDKTVTDLRDKTLLAFDVDQVVRLTLSTGQTTLEASKEKATWTLEAPVKAKADADEVTGLLRSLRYARAKDFLPGTVPALDRPDLTIRLWEKDAKGAKVVRLARGRSPDQVKGQAVATTTETLYALAEPGQGVVTVDPNLLKDLDKTPLQLRDRRLFVFENTDIAKIRLEVPGHPDKSFTLERSGDKWSLVDPKLGEAEGLKVRDFLWALRNLKFQQIVDEAGNADASYGLDTPQVEVRLTKTDGTALPPLLIGRTQKAQVYAKLRGAPPVYALASRLLNDLPQDATALKKNDRATAKK